VRTERRKRRRLMSEINVVPYIDVTLVLLIIFMITAPLITQGVKIELPKISSEVLPPQEREPVIISVDAGGDYYVNYGKDRDQPVDSKSLLARVGTLLRQQPNTRFLVEGDAKVAYRRVVELMALLQGAGVSSVGLVTEPPEE